MDTCPKRREKFVDSEKCFGLIKELETIVEDDPKQEALVESFRKFIDPYLEEPELLYPYLGDLIKELTQILDDFDIPGTRYHTVFKFLYQLIRVTGFKQIGQKFPHDTGKLPLLIQLLSKENTQDKENWQTRYVLTVWLSIAILAPFDLNKFDPAGVAQEKGISEKIFTTLTRSLAIHDSCQHVAAYCLSKYFARSDVIKNDLNLSKFIADALKEISTIKTGLVNSTDDVKPIGYLRALSYMFKYMPRAELKSYSRPILSALGKLEMDKINRELVMHLMVKLIQRVGMSLLPKQSASWRHKRNCRVLGQVNLQGGAEFKDLTDKEVAPYLSGIVESEAEPREEACELDQEEENNSKENLEMLVSILFSAAQNSHTKVRWSASKGLARLSSRLSRDRAGEVIDLVIANFFDPNASEYAWHSGCLTLAEMSRIGLLMEEKLKDVTRIISEAIIYDKIKGSFAVGSHIREAACYVCWAIARTYEDHLLKPHLATIITNLLCTMLFDRELQCRRAASATFQELIGRQGTSDEECISILTSADYQNLGQRNYSYIELAKEIAGRGEKYAHPFVDHLLEKKIGHWDIQIRRLASDSLACLIPYTTKAYVNDIVLPKLVEMCNPTTENNNAKHGAILALARVISALVPMEFVFDEALEGFLGKLVKLCEKQLKIKQQAPYFMESLCFVISSAEIAHFSYPADSDTIKQWETISMTALDNDNPQIREAGASALFTLYRTYYSGSKGHQDRLLCTLNKSLDSINESSRCGALRALGKLSRVPSETINGTTIKLDADTPDIILQTLSSYISKPTHELEVDKVFAEAKAESCESFVEFVRNLDAGRLIVSSGLIEAGFEAILEKTKDYTFDKRGDIGVVVRRAAVRAVKDLTLHLLSIGMKQMFSRERTTTIIAHLLQQCVSYNNSAREQACQAFYRLIMSDLLNNQNLLYKQEMIASFESHQVTKDFNWRDESTPIFVSLLSKSEFCSDLWQGLLPSVGQASEICAKQFRDALFDYISSLNDPQEKQNVMEDFIETLKQPNLPERLLNSGLVVADFLLTQGLFEGFPNEQILKRLLDFVWSVRNNDPKRLMAIARVLCSMVQVSQDSRQADLPLKHCLQLLMNGSPKVRACTSELLYPAIMNYQPDVDSKVEKVLELLSETDWTQPLTEVRKVCDEIASYL